MIHTTLHEGGVTVVRPGAERLTAVNAVAFKTDVCDLVAAGSSQLVIDFEEVSFLDSRRSRRLRTGRGSGPYVPDFAYGQGVYRLSKCRNRRQHDQRTRMTGSVFTMPHALDEVEPMVRKTRPCGSRSV